MPEEVLLLRKSFREGVSPDVTGGMVAAFTFNASHQTSWLHLCGKDPWTVLPWPPQLTRDLERYLMGQVLEWWTGQLTNEGLRSPEGSYIMWETLQRARHKISRENIVVLRKVTVIKVKRNIFKNYSTRTLSMKNFVHHICLFIAFPCFLTILSPLRVLSTSLKPSFLAHSLQIYCIGLFGL